ncbi:uncharacterized protein LOC134241466 [Saccostrea cucullata]|uniref:uncharacterized protein LOC134241466 n=1 Tax=Saccostrea cuccullata TaxID=36930 RepID=UPI002ED09553
MELVNLVTGLYEIKFEFLKEVDVGRIVKFKPDIAFASPEYDVLVLELEDHKFELKCLGLVEDNACNEKLHVFGHPSGKPLQHDPACTILKEDTDLSELKKEGIAFFKKECKSLEEKDIEESYSPCVISKDKILFHSSCSTAHGASGAPLIIVCNGSPKVYGMLLCGHPGVFYNYFNGRLKRLDLLVESGISMKKVRSLLKSFIPNLEKDLFRDV